VPDRADRAYIIESANRFLIAGLVFLGLAIVGAITLITDYIFGIGGQWYWPAIIAAGLVGLWFVRPLLRSDSSGP
jgi:hypothetical protein